MIVHPTRIRRFTPPLRPRYRPTLTSSLTYSDIGSATSATYNITTSDIGKYLSVRVTAVNSYGQAVVYSNEIGLVAGLAPTSAVAPSIVGSPRQGLTVTSSTGVWNNTPVSYAYEWQKDTLGNGSYSAIPAATTSTYTPVAGDVGSNLKLKVTATNASGSNIAYSSVAHIAGSAGVIQTLNRLCANRLSLGI